MNEKSQQLVKKLQLVPHPEGGFYKETYRSKDIIAPPSDRYDGNSRNASTSIYYLLDGHDFSAWHRVKSDEMWQFCSGCSLALHLITKEGQLQSVKIGDPLVEDDALYHFWVEQGQWFCALPNDQEGYTLVSCIVSPGFDFRDFELANRDKLILEHPQYSELISKYTRVTELALPSMNEQTHMMSAPLNLRM